MTEQAEQNDNRLTGRQLVYVLAAAGLLLAVGVGLLMFSTSAMVKMCSKNMLYCGGGLVGVVVAAVTISAGFVYVNIGVKSGGMTRKQGAWFAAAAWLAAWLVMRHFIA